MNSIDKDGMSSLLDHYNAQVASGALTPDPAQFDVIEAFSTIDQALLQKPTRSWFGRAKPQTIKGLYLFGGVGRGKSMLMDMFVEHLKWPARRTHFHNLMQELHHNMHLARQEGVKDPLMPAVEQIAEGLRVLALDEMQITDITDAMIVGRFFEALFAQGVTIVTTSNRHPKDLYKNGLNRQLFLPFIDLIGEHMEIFELKSPTDYRQDRLKGKDVYFSPMGPQSTAQMNTLWQELVKSEPAPLGFDVKGRRVTLPKFADGVARAGFHDLCGAALGPGDFLEIAQRIRVLFLDDIPQMSRSNFNQAKRFVTLIDALYEAKVRLIASAAAAPEYLYLEGEGAFEFERTASRLREMQAHDWGSDPN